MNKLCVPRGCVWPGGVTIGLFYTGPVYGHGIFVLGVVCDHLWLYK